MTSRFALTLGLATLACSGSDRSLGHERTGDGATGLSTAGDEAGSGSATAAEGEDGAGEESPPRFDVVSDSGGTAGDTAPPGPSCSVGGNGDAFTNCETKAPPDSFDPQIEWDWVLPQLRYSIVTPLVANLTDDDGNGIVDLCDTPDVVVVGAADILQGTGYIASLDGESGELHWMNAGVARVGTPAIADVDGDGAADIITYGGDKVLRTYRGDGTVLWEGDPWPSGFSAALAVADFDNDGDPEIYGGRDVFDHNGHLLFSTREPSEEYGTASTAADLDGDGDLELITGPQAFHHDGAPMWSAAVAQGHPHVANLDDDPEPEVLITSGRGYSLLEHDGTIKYMHQNANGVPNIHTERVWRRPAAIHDFDGDGTSEFAQSSGQEYTLFDREGRVMWTTPVSDSSGVASGTAFDFLGDGVAEAIYGDENFSHVFDGKTGEVILSTRRSSRTLIDFPVVADVDNDGSAEIVTVASDYLSGGGEFEPVPWVVQVVGDAEDRWIPARRIWNQHSYHVTNIREDGTVPQHERASWKDLNTFRTQAQVENGGVCRPPVAG